MTEAGKQNDCIIITLSLPRTAQFALCGSCETHLLQNKQLNHANERRDELYTALRPKHTASQLFASTQFPFVYLYFQEKHPGYNNYIGRAFPLTAWLQESRFGDLYSPRVTETG